MANAREIRTKINSIKNTRQITRAMEMVAASKMRKAQERMFASRPYAEKILDVIGHLANSHPEFRHQFFEEREEVKKVGYIIVSTDRGLCGGLNINLFKLALKSMEEWQDKGAELELCLLGQKAEHFFKRVGGNVAASAVHLGDAPGVKQLIGVVNVMFKAYAKGNIDRLYLLFNRFENTMIQRPQLEQVLPLVKKDDKKLKYYWDYIYEPDAKEVLEMLLTRYIESQVYQAAVENIASEQSARMVAMKSASENAAGIIDDLQLAYNKARQSAITSELADIIGGAEALNG